MSQFYALAPASFNSAATAQKAAEKAEVEAFGEAKKRRLVPAEQAAVAAQMTFGAFAQEQPAHLALADSTNQNYPRSPAHLVPTFGDRVIRDITDKAVDAWERDQLTEFAVSSVRTYRSLLHRLLAEAVDADTDEAAAGAPRGRSPPCSAPSSSLSGHRCSPAATTSS